MHALIDVLLLSSHLTYSFVSFLVVDAVESITLTRYRVTATVYLSYFRLCLFTRLQINAGQISYKRCIVVSNEKNYSFALFCISICNGRCEELH